MSDIRRQAISLPRPIAVMLVVWLADPQRSSNAERARALIAITDPRFREELERSARETGLLD